MTKKSFVVRQNARSKRQLKIFDQIIREGICPFCPLHRHRFFPKVLRQGRHWDLVTNNWPYKGSSLHLMLIYRRHATRLGDLKTDSGREVWTILQRIEKSYRLKSGSIGLRFGDPRFNGGTVDHLHLHLVVADSNPPPGQRRLRFAMGPKPKPL